jgi:hypothetical protein
MQPIMQHRVVISNQLLKRFSINKSADIQNKINNLQTPKPNITNFIALIPFYSLQEG